MSKSKIMSEDGVLTFIKGKVARWMYHYDEGKCDACGTKVEGLFVNVKTDNESEGFSSFLCGICITVLESEFEIFKKNENG